LLVGHWILYTGLFGRFQHRGFQKKAKASSCMRVQWIKLVLHCCIS
jgi:hypothetical protein